MGDKEDGPAGDPVKVQEDIVHEQPSGFRIQPLEGLVQKEQIPGGQKGAKKGRPPALSAGHFPGRLTGAAGKAGLIQRRKDFPAGKSGAGHQADVGDGA